MTTRRASLPVLTLLLLLAVSLSSSVAVFAQAHEPAAPAPVSAQAPAVPHDPAAVEHAKEAHGSEHAVRDVIAKLLNFGVLVGALVYFLKGPIAGYLAGRSAQIRQDLVTAAEMRKTATARLEEIHQKLAALPAELAALETRGEEDVRAEKARIAGDLCQARDARSRIAGTTDPGYNIDSWPSAHLRRKFPACSAFRSILSCSGSRCPGWQYFIIIPCASRSPAW